MYRQASKFAIIPILLLTLVLSGCNSPAQSARDSIAAAQGLIVAAQATHGDQCRKDATPKVCQVVKRAVSAQNATVTALETYCGWAPGAPPADPEASCVPVKSAESALVTTTQNLNQIITELKGAIQ